MRTRRLALLAVLSLAACAVALDAMPHAFAQAPPRNPLSIGITEGGGSAGGITGWILAKQAEFYRSLTATLRAARADGSAGWTLIGLSLLYGVFHAAGPGHGKAVVTAYLVANERALKRGLAISFAAAMLQAVVAVTLVLSASLILGATARSMTAATGLIERASFAAIAALGLWLVWRKGRGLIAEWQARREGLVEAAESAVAARAGSFVCAHGLTYRPSGQGAALAFTASGSAAASSGCDCGTMHAPDPARLGSDFSWREAAATTFAAGLRPCSGAIIVLVFALAQGMLGLGIAAAFAMALGTAVTTGVLAALAVYAKDRAVRFAGPRGRAGALAIRGLELAAAFAVLIFGVGLFIGSGGMN
jgi:ABC-type nickel/cobalt efflux system permease component RcnA